MSDQWETRYVVDPAGAPPYGYTVGAAGVAGCEVLLPARESGPHPESWQLDPQTHAMVLRRAVEAVVAGSLTVGTELVEVCEGGLTTLTLRGLAIADVGEGACEALGNPPGTPVLMCSLRVARHAPGVDAGLPDTQHGEWVRAAAELEVGESRPRHPQERGGPWGGMVAALCARLEEIEAVEVLEVLRLSSPSITAQLPGSADELAHAAEHARAHGRTRALREACEDVVASVALGVEAQHAELADVWGSEDLSQLQRVVESAALAAAGAWVVREHISEAAFLRMSGVVEVAFHPGRAGARGWPQVQAHAERLAEGGAGPLSDRVRARWAARGSVVGEASWYDEAMAVVHLLAAQRGVGGLGVQALAHLSDLDAATYALAGEPGENEAEAALEDILTYHLVAEEARILLGEETTQRLEVILGGF